MIRRSANLNFRVVGMDEALQSTSKGHEVIQKEAE